MSVERARTATSLAPPETVDAREHGRPAELRFAAALTSVAEGMEDALVSRWGTLTGLQIVFIKKVARATRITRTALMIECRTSRAACVPGLAALLHGGFLTETGDDGERVLMMGPAGVDLLVTIESARATWVRGALANADADMLSADLHHAADLLGRLLP